MCFIVKQMEIANGLDKILEQRSSLFSIFFLLIPKPSDFTFPFKLGASKDRISSDRYKSPTPYHGSGTIYGTQHIISWILSMFPMFYHLSIKTEKTRLLLQLHKQENWGSRLWLISSKAGVETYFVLIQTQFFCYSTMCFSLNVRKEGKQ